MRRLLKTRDLIMSGILPSRNDLLSEVGMPGLVEERLHMRFAKVFGIAASFAIFSAVAWSAFAKVNEVSIAKGALQPIGFEQTVQHLEGGIVQDILVREGQVVQRGDTLLVMNDTTTLEDDETLERQNLDLLGQLEGQKALQEGRAPDFSFIPPNRNLERLNNLNAYTDAKSSLEAQRLGFDSQIHQTSFALEALKAQVRGAEEEAEHAEAEESRFGKLLKKGVVTDIQASEKRRQRLRAQADLAALVSREAAAAARNEEVVRQKQSFEATQKAAFSQRILEIEGALTALDGRIRKKDNRLQRLTVAAPISGVVKSVNIRGTGAVVAPGQALVVLVPLDKPLVAETRIGAEQIGYLRLGLPAQVKISAFDFTRYGWLPGHVESISPSAFETESGRSYYIVRVALDQTSLERAPSARLLPGMDLTADIITGEKTFLQYLLTPLQRTFSEAFGER
ncbi:HlyD family type I secretion periplasmic adaptor subunit [Roseibium suaedae]|uniref:Membrane fusion protein (MFP) family protein n=1 Tax=Roseibium suaedae TaxID=735517 RepID=A0A1M7I0T7_9HYPH|nr:HlyD family type I secretion periplasmic adaptor subunit [Roseibium suaedae]SHM34335.1 HlyD family secretion protein/membrane fusion protein, adhesin transport system [Roseibium suaedae]